jgi:hypothetical protein
MASYKKRVRLSVTEYDKVIRRYGEILKALDKELGLLSTNINTIQKGDSEGPYWNGKQAQKFFKESIINVDKDIQAYNALARVYKALVEKRKMISTKKIND